ncbi:glycosyl hydrolase family 18 protein [Streptomyces sp. NPDC091377]|uniref:glycosyl hydrolase family 18 protein n=1 Tax=Streptomyces sp. NPDC091377 TaxID=3365995 RepID=UPI0038109984
MRDSGQVRTRVRGGRSRDVRGRARTGVIALLAGALLAGTVPVALAAVPERPGAEKEAAAVSTATQRTATGAADTTGSATTASTGGIPTGQPVHIQNIGNGSQLGMTRRLTGPVGERGEWLEAQVPAGEDKEKHQSWRIEATDGGHLVRNVEVPDKCAVRDATIGSVVGPCTAAHAVWDISSPAEDEFRFGVPGSDARLVSTGQIHADKRTTDLDMSTATGAGAGWFITPLEWPRLPMPPEDRRTLEHMTYLTTHNAMINTEDGYGTSAPNQPHSMKRQLADGVRALMPDVNKEVVNGRIPLCHGGSCGREIVESNSLDGMLRTVKEFLDANPREIISIFIEDQGSLSNQDYETYGLKLVPGIRDLLFVPDDAQVTDPALKQGWNVHHNGWPLLKDMIAKNKRLLIFSGLGNPDRVDRQPLGFMHDQRWRVENYWSMGMPGGVADWTCYSRWAERPLSTRPSGKFRPLFMMNHFRTWPSAPASAEDNARLKERADRVCTTAARRKPNFVAVDQYKDGDPFPQIREMNTYWWQGQREAGTAPGTGDAGDPFDNALDDRAPKPAVSGPHSACRPDGMAATPGVEARYCEVYDTAGREWLGGGGHDKRIVGYFNATRNGTDGRPRYLVKNIPWSKVTHINYAFAGVAGNRISIGDESAKDNPATGMTWPGVEGAEMDPALPYQGHFNQLATYKKRHPQVKSLIAVGGWTASRGFYEMATRADGSVDRAGVDAFADSVVAFLDRYGAAFDGVDIDYEYPTAVPDSGNPDDWPVSNPRRKGLQAGYNALMKTLREKLDRAGAERGRYYLLTSAASASGHLVRGYDGGQALAYQDFVNVMTYDLHGSWNQYVGPQAPLYDDGRDGELAAAGIYDSAKNPEYDRTGYFNVDWAYHYYRGALQPGRINLGIPYYTRGWREVQGGTDGLWGTAALPDQGQCQPGTGSRTPCGNGAVGIDNLWHDTSRGREVAAGVNPLWHAKNLQAGTVPGYLDAFGLDTSRPENRLTGTYRNTYSTALEAGWLWNAEKKVFLTTEDERSLDAKAGYIKDNGIGGVMMWELSGDYTRSQDGTYRMGYDLTSRIDRALHGSGPAKADRAGSTPLPDQVLDVSVEFADHPTEERDLWPQQPKLRITNHSGRELPSGTELSFDIPTSAPPLLKDEAWREMKDEVRPGRSGPNTGGLKADFHRVTIKLGYCEAVPARGTRDIGIKYFLPLTGPANLTARIGDTTYGLTQDRRRGTEVVEPPATGGGPACQAAAWDAGRTYNPVWAPFTLWKTGDRWKIQDVVSSNVLDHPGSWTTAHLVDAQNGNANQLWNITPAGEGRMLIKSATSGREQCLTATGLLADLAVRDCDGSPGQRWQFTDEKGAPTPAVPGDNQPHSLKAANGFVMEPRNSGIGSGTRAVAGDPGGTTRTVVSHGGYYWRAKYWTKGTVPDASDPQNPWARLGKAA